MLPRPEEPVGDIAVETAIKLRAVQGLLPGIVKRGEVAEAMMLVEGAEGEIEENLDVSAMRMFEPNVLDQRHLLQHVLLGASLVEAAVDHGQRDRVRDLEHEQCRHAEESVDLTRDHR